MHAAPEHGMLRHMPLTCSSVCPVPHPGNVRCTKQGPLTQTDVSQSRLCVLERCTRQGCRHHFDERSLVDSLLHVHSTQTPKDPRTSGCDPTNRVTYVTRKTQPSGLHLACIWGLLGCDYSVCLRLLNHIQADSERHKGSARQSIPL